MSPILLERFDKSLGHMAVDVLVAFSSTAALDVRALADAIEEEVARALMPDELLILVRATAFADAMSELRSSTQGQALIERLEGRCRVDLVGYDASGSEATRENLSITGISSNVGLDEILRRGVTAIFKRRDGFVRASKSYHFANPSGAHTDRFMRLSNILVRQAEIAFLGAAVLARLPGDTRQVYIDTPALYAVVSAINDQLRTLQPERAHLVADNFSSYFGFDTHRFTDPAQAVALISASSSGRLGRKLVEEKHFDPHRIVHVLYLGPKPAGPTVAIDLGLDHAHNPQGFSTERRTFDAGDCALCREDSIPIGLKGDQFDIAGPQHPPLIIKKTDAPKGLATVMSRLAGTGALRVSLEQRQFDIDPGKLLKSDEYLRRLDYLLRRQVPAGLEAVIVVDPDARLFVDRVSDVIGARPKVVEREKVAGMGQGRASPLKGAVLVVASVIGSGRLLLDVSRDLRNVAPDAPIIYLVAFAKVQDSERKQTFNRSLVQTDKAVAHVVEYAEELLLPAHPPVNAWQDELAFLQRNRSAWPPPATSFLTARIERLRKTSSPLKASLFLPDHKGAALGLRDGFVFWPANVVKRNTHSQADVFYTIASVLQQLRTAEAAKGEQAIRTNWMQQTILSPENFGRFNDGIIQASLLRAARPSELDFRDDADASRDAARLIRRVVESAEHPRGEAAAEFLLAIGTGRLKLCPADGRMVLSDLPAAPDLVTALVAMCRAEIGRPDRPASASAARRKRRRPAAKPNSASESTPTLDDSPTLEV